MLGRRAVQLARQGRASVLRRPHCRCQQHGRPSTTAAAQEEEEAFIFTADNFANPELPHGLAVVDVPLLPATDENLEGFGFVLHSEDQCTVEKGTFEITPWPTTGWRSLDPETGDEAGTTEGDFVVRWEGDHFVGENLAIATSANTYLDGLGAPPELASATEPVGDGGSVYLWMSDYHPDGGQLFWPRQPIPFFACLGPAAKGDDITPADMRAFYVPAGKGVYVSLQPRLSLCSPPSPLPDSLC